jgi:two-component system, OmpR family, response regulator ResD
VGPSPIGSLDPGGHIDCHHCRLRVAKMSLRKKILVVDDEVMIRNLLTRVLELDYDVIIAEDGLSGVDKAASEKPDLVITDGLLPKLHGFLACKAIKQMNPAPKVILLTGIYTKPTYKWEVIDQYDADEVITKPARPAELIACIEKHLCEAGFQSASTDGLHHDASRQEWARR